MKRLLAAVGLSLLLAACGHGGSKAQTASNSGAIPAADASFLAQNAKAPGVVVLPSGLQYKIIHSGPATGAHPGPADEVKVNYEGKLVDGKVFDSSFQRGEPADLALDAVIPGWTEALQLMRPGDEWMLYLPPDLGYADHSPDPDTIPNNSVLIFRIQLLGVLQHPSAQG